MRSPAEGEGGIDGGVGGGGGLGRREEEVEDDGEDDNEVDLCEMIVERNGDGGLGYLCLSRFLLAYIVSNRLLTHPEAEAERVAPDCIGAQVPAQPLQAQSAGAGRRGQADDGGLACSRGV